MPSRRLPTVLAALALLAASVVLLPASARHATPPAPTLTWSADEPGWVAYELDSSGVARVDVVRRFAGGVGTDAPDAGGFRAVGVALLDARGELLLSAILPEWTQAPIVTAGPGLASTDGLAWWWRVPGPSAFSAACEGCGAGKLHLVLYAGGTFASVDVEVRMQGAAVRAVSSGPGAFALRSHQFGGVAHAQATFHGQAATAAAEASVAREVEGRLVGVFTGPRQEHPRVPADAANPLVVRPCACPEDVPFPSAPSMRVAKPAEERACPCAFGGADDGPGAYVFSLTGVFAEDDVVLAGADVRLPGAAAGGSA